MPGASDVTRQQFDALTGGQLVTLATYLKSEGTWKAFHVPAVTTAPTATQAAGAAGVKNVLLGFTFALSAVAAQAINTVYITLRDGATGAGTILAQWPVIAAITTQYTYGLSGLYVPGTAATAMTMEMTNQAGAVTNPAGGNFAFILMWGNTET